MNLLTHKTLTSLKSTLEEDQKNFDGNSISGEKEGKIPFTISKPQFDQNTAFGRFEAFRRSVNPFHSVYPNANILLMREIIE
jgi:hypothetical protein